MLAPNLDAILADLRPAARRLAVRRRRWRRLARGGTLALCVSVGVASAAVGAWELLGRSAPPRVQRELRDVDRGLPADLRLNPDVEHARSVALSVMRRSTSRRSPAAATARSSSPAGTAAAPSARRRRRPTGHPCR